MRLSCFDAAIYIDDAIIELSAAAIYFIYFIALLP